jgi:hypothetical protein
MSSASSGRLHSIDPTIVKATTSTSTANSKMSINSLHEHNEQQDQAKKVETEVSTAVKVCKRLEVDLELELCGPWSTLIEGTRATHSASLIERSLVARAVEVSLLAGISFI